MSTDKMEPAGSAERRPRTTRVKVSRAHEGFDEAAIDGIRDALEALLLAAEPAEAAA